MEVSVNNPQFRAGDRVCYSKAHWEWLKKAGLVLAASKRRAFLGTVISVERDHLTVDWKARGATPLWRSVEGFPLPPMPTSHLPENLVGA